MSIEQRTKEAIATVMGIDVDRISNEQTLDDLGADSLDAVEIIMELEEEFNVEIEDEACDNLKTVQDIIDLAVSKAA